MEYNILALGDCNTSGDIKFPNNSFPERFAKKIKFKIKNCGYTMSTSQEMIYFFDEYFHENINIILIQYGLVDSWKTFKYSPYISYYPDSTSKKFIRKVIKKYKKIARILNLNRFLGEKYTVEPKQYRANIEYVLKKSLSSIVFLIETVPNKELFRNEHILLYNNILEDLSKKYKNCYTIKLYDLFKDNFDSFYLDQTHINDKGYDIIAEKIYIKYIQIMDNS